MLLGVLVSTVVKCTTTFVRCDQCQTEIAMYDQDEVYHFFNIVASHTWASDDVGGDGDSDDVGHLVGSPYGVLTRHFLNCQNATCIVMVQRCKNYYDVFAI